MTPEERIKLCMSIVTAVPEQNYYRIYGSNLLSKGFRYLGCGASRAGYASLKNTVVIKVPRNPSGVIDNLIEATAYSRYRNKPTPNKQQLLTPCRLLPNGCLMMKFVERWYGSSKSLGKQKPFFIGRADGCQGGFYQFTDYSEAVPIQKEKLVLYDFAHDVNTERMEMWSKYFPHDILYLRD